MALLAGVDGDRDLLRQMVRVFLTDYPQRAAEIKEAVRRGDAVTVERAAHTLKGALGNFAANIALAAAQELETMAKRGDLDAAGDAAATLDSELALLAEELRRLTTNSSKRPSRTHKGARQESASIGGHSTE
ncbi:MAG: Hpt domain-containing protein [Acidobacteria bacterium Pan2503]|uniref:Hpt domain-containing protein n=1 Tax=Candidatus Acidiferrum panamense TaxID=2741543 RepID=A0A7V8NV18_9BACT|nr:Hpt domain-containing protein [Candidatus Acidoferrum panamensis]